MTIALQEIALKGFTEIANKHASRLEKAFAEISYLSPLTPEKIENLSEKDLNFLDILVFRFMKLQDLIGGKIFSIVLQTVKENTEGTTTLDRINLMEKIDMLSSAREWSIIREARNAVAHEYPDDKMAIATGLNEVINHTKWLLNYWKWLQEKIQERIFKI